MKPLHGMQAHASSPYLSKDEKPNFFTEAVIIHRVLLGF
jgi:hypothetical protein